MHRRFAKVHAALRGVHSDRVRFAEPNALPPSWWLDSRRLVVIAILALTAGLLAGAISPPMAAATPPWKVLADCADDDVLQGNYSTADLRRARKSIPADVDQYGPCRDILAREIAARVSHSSGGSSSPGGDQRRSAADRGRPVLPTTVEDQRDLDDAYARGAEPRRVGRLNISPAAAPLAVGARHELPPQLLVVLGLLCCCVLIVALGAARIRLRR